MTKRLRALRALRYLIQKGGPEALSPGIKVTGKPVLLTGIVLLKVVQCFFVVSVFLRVEVDDQGMAVKAGFASGLPDLCHSVTVLMMFDVEVNGYAVHSHLD